MIIKAENREMVAPLFQDWQETLIWSCLQGIMGEIYIKKQERPVSAMAILGDFCFFSGEADKELVAFKPQDMTQDFIIMVPQNEAWAQAIEAYYGQRAKKVVRYAIKKEPQAFDEEKLWGIVKTLPLEYTLQRMDETLFAKCLTMDWCRDWVSQYKDYAGYEQYGLGMVIVKDGEPVCGASSYSRYRGGIEIQIDTKEEYRRKGLASICGARLILECLKRNLYPSWDAQNKWSVALAEKLGYHYDHEYSAYEILGY